MKVTEKLEPEVKQSTEKSNSVKTEMIDKRTLETKMDAILEKLPLIERCNEICNFILSHYKLEATFKAELAKETDARDKAELYRVFEIYGVPQ